MSVDNAPQEDQDFLKDMIRQVIQETQGGTPPPAPVAPPAAPAPLKVKLGEQEFEFKDAEEMGQRLTQVLTLAAEARNVPAPTKPKEVDGAPEWDQTQFEQYLTSDVKKGYQYAMSQVLGVEDPRNAFQSMAGELVRLKQKDAYREFAESHPELKAALPQLIPIVDQTRQQYNMPLDAGGYEAAYIMAQRAGKIPQFAAPATPPPAPVTNPNLAPPPNVARGGDNTAGFGQDLEDLSVEQLQALQHKLYRNTQ
jgi:hypothetical protein